MSHDHATAEKLLGMISEAIGGATKERKVLKTFPMKPEWAKLYKRLTEATDEALAAYEKSKSLKKKFWGSVEDDLEIYDKSFSYNEETKEVEVLETN